MYDFGENIFMNNEKYLDELDGRLQVLNELRKRIIELSKAIIGDTLYGFNIHGVVFDELHTQPNRKLFDVMTKGSGDARTQPLYFLITTAGTDTNSMLSTRTATL